MKKRLLAMVISGILLLTACRPDKEHADKEKTIYASFYPVYALSKLVLDDIPEIELKCLVQPQDDCLRLYDLSDWDASVLAYDADAVIIAGNGLESFENLLYTFGDNGPAIITATYNTELYTAGEAGNQGDQTHFAGKNPHSYMSIPLASEMLQTIVNSLKELYPELDEVFDDKLAIAAADFSELEKTIGELYDRLQNTPVIIMNEALIYTARDLGLNIEYIYERESGTTLYGSALEDAISVFNNCDSSVILIEKQAPAELLLALNEAGFRVAEIDIMSAFSYESDRDYFEIQKQNAANIAAAFE